MEIVNVFAQFGVPTFILGFVLWFLLRPLVMVLVKNIEAQTEFWKNYSQPFRLRR